MKKNGNKSRKKLIRKGYGEKFRKKKSRKKMRVMERKEFQKLQEIEKRVVKKIARNHEKTGLKKWREVVGEKSKESDKKN